jgi:hypothetical protein
MRALPITVREPGLRPCRAIVICTGNRGGGKPPPYGEDSNQRPYDASNRRDGNIGRADDIRPYGRKRSRGCIRIMGRTAEYAHRHSRTGAIARHGRRPGSRTVMRKANTACRFRRMGFQREGRLCAKPFPLACLSSDSFRTNGKNRPPGGWTSQRIPPGQPGRLAAPAGENDTCQKVAERSRPFPTVGVSGTSARSAGPYARRRETRLDFFRYRYSGTPRTYKTAASPAPTSAASSAKPCQNAAGV